MSSLRTPAGKFPAHTEAHLLDLEDAADRLLAGLAGHSRQTETLAREAGVSVVMMAMEAGDTIREHSTKGAVSLQLLRGHTVVRAGEAVFDLRPGQLVLIRPEIKHDVRAEEQSVIVLTISGGDPSR